jgi:hypothetical protein
MCHSRERKLNRTWRELGGETPWCYLARFRGLEVYVSVLEHPGPRCSLQPVATWCVLLFHSTPHLPRFAVSYCQTRGPIALVATPTIRSFAAAPPTSTVDHRHPAPSNQPRPLPPCKRHCHPPLAATQPQYRCTQHASIKPGPSKRLHASIILRLFPRFVPRLLPLHLRFTPRVTHSLTLDPISMLPH